MSENIEEKDENESYIQVAIRVCIFNIKKLIFYYYYYK